MVLQEYTIISQNLDSTRYYDSTPKFMVIQINSQIHDFLCKH